MFDFTRQEEEVITAIERNYQQQLNQLMVSFFSRRDTIPIEDVQFESWLFSIEQVHLICEKWLIQMTESPDFADHLGDGVLSAIVRSGGAVFGTVVDGITGFLPEPVRRRMWGNQTASGQAADIARNTFSTALGPFVTRFLHNAFCRTYHGSPDKAEELFNEAIDKQDSLLTSLIRQECETLSIELIKLFRFREMLVLGTRDKMALNYDARQALISHARIQPADIKDLDTVIEYYFIRQLYEIFQNGFQRLYAVHATEISDEKESVVLQWLNSYFDSKAQREAFTRQMQLEFMQMTRDFLLAKMNEKSFTGKHPWLVASGVGLMASLLVAGLIALTFGFHAVIGVAAFAVLSFAMGFLACRLATSKIEFFQYKRGKTNRQHIQEAIDTIHHEYLRMHREIQEMVENQGEWVTRSQRFASLAECYFFCRSNSKLARGSVTSWLREYAAHYRHSKAMAIDLVGIYEKIVTQSRRQNAQLRRALSNGKSKPLSYWIKNTSKFLLDSEQAEAIRDFELIEKFREQTLDIVRTLPKNSPALHAFYCKPITDGGLGGDPDDFSRIQRLGNPKFSYLANVAKRFYKDKEPLFTDRAFFQGYPPFRKILNLNPGRGTNGLNSTTVDQWLDQTHELLLSLCHPVDAESASGYLRQSSLLSDEFIIYRMLLLQQFAQICRGIDRHCEKEVILKIENFVQQFFHAEPDVIFDDFINSSFLLQSNSIADKEQPGQNNNDNIKAGMAHVFEVLKMSMAYISQAFTPLQALQYYRHKYPRDEQHFIALRDSKSVLNPQGSQYYVNTLKLYYRDTQRFLQQEDTRTGLHHTNILNNYRFLVSEAVFRLMVSIAQDLEVKNQVSNSDKQQHYLLQALRCSVHFVEAECYLPAEGSSLLSFWNNINRLADIHKPDTNQISQTCNLSNYETNLTNISAQLQNSRESEPEDKVALSI